jgi:hypothetical protein
LKVKLHSFQPCHSAGAVLFVFVLLLLIAGCVISPRRIVVNNPSPTPTPNISPTPTPGGITPTPTPTPTPASAQVPQTGSQFLFAGDAVSPWITGFRLNSDGSLAPLPGSPFAAGAPVRALHAVRDGLMVETENAVSFYRVNQETGELQQDSASAALSASDLSRLAAAGPQTAALDAAGKFMYVVDVQRAELLAFRVEKGKLVLLPPVYPVMAGTGSLALVFSSN